MCTVTIKWASLRQLGKARDALGQRRWWRERERKKILYLAPISRRVERKYPRKASNSVRETRIGDLRERIDLSIVIFSIQCYRLPANLFKQEESIVDARDVLFCRMSTEASDIRFGDPIWLPFHSQHPLERDITWSDLSWPESNPSLDWNFSPGDSNDVLYK